MIFTFNTAKESYGYVGYARYVSFQNLKVTALELKRTFIKLNDAKILEKHLTVQIQISIS